MIRTIHLITAILCLSGCAEDNPLNLSELSNVLFRLDRFCTGFAISPRHILTAGHCYNLSSAESVDGARFMRFERCLVHPSAAPGSGFDVGVCLTSERMERFWPISWSHVDLRAGTKLLMAGVSAERLTSRVWEGTIAEIRDELIVEIEPQFLCNGESGGPAILADSGLLVGVASSRSRWAPCNWVEAKKAKVRYTDLNRVRDWLEQMMSQDE